MASGVPTCPPHDTLTDVTYCINPASSKPSPASAFKSILLRLEPDRGMSAQGSNFFGGGASVTDTGAAGGGAGGGIGTTSTACALISLSASTATVSLTCLNLTVSRGLICPTLQRSASITTAGVLYPPVVWCSANRMTGLPSGGSCTVPLTHASLMICPPSMTGDLAVLPSTTAIRSKRGDTLYGPWVRANTSLGCSAPASEDGSAGPFTTRRTHSRGSAVLAPRAFSPASNPRASPPVRSRLFFEGPAALSLELRIGSCWHTSGSSSSVPGSRPITSPFLRGRPW
mmetsp:Transcript_40788/g.49483  ORF Transcript_40788/g.49483 Transcript_40788/m.49483 type:complete len:286 (+) Transcript_40788:878-1735(+)